MAGPNYSEQEAAVILKRAAELQQTEGGDPRKMSLGELEAAAEEAGIDRALVRRAASEVARAGGVSSRDSVFCGGPILIAIEATIEGEVPASAHEDIVGTIRHRTGEHGSHDVLGRTLSWTSRSVGSQPGMGRHITVSVSPRSEATNIRVEERLNNLAGALFGGILGGVGGGGTSLAIVPVLVAGAPYLLPLTLGVWLGGVYYIVRRIYQRKTRDREKELGELLRALVLVAQEATHRS